MEHGRPPSAGQRLTFRRLAVSALPFLGILGALLYVVLRVYYVLFYLPLRATPEEVGYGYLEVLAGQSLGTVLLVLGGAAILSGVAVLLLVAVRAARLAVLRGQQVNPLTRSMVLATVRWSVVAAITLTVFGLPALAWESGVEASHGHTKRNLYVNGFRLPILAVAAVPAKVDWASDSHNPKFDLTERQCLLYLGQANGVSVFYDAASTESIRLPTADIVVSLQNHPTVPVGC